MSDGWNHNTHYHRHVLAAIPHGAERALDVGCGLGGFARKLAAFVPAVDAIDRDPDVIARAGHAPGVRFAVADVMTMAVKDYDMITMIATLHHLPVRSALAVARNGLRRGGVLAVVGLFSTRTVGEWATNVIAWPVSYAQRWTRGLAEVGAPLAEPTTTLAEIRAVAAEILPGAQITRRLLWRYTLFWTKP